MEDEKSHWITSEVPRNDDLNQIILGNMDCVAILLGPSSREIGASNQAAIKVQPVPEASAVPSASPIL